MGVTVSEAVESCVSTPPGALLKDAASFLGGDEGVGGRCRGAREGVGE